MIKTPILPPLPVPKPKPSGLFLGLIIGVILTTSSLLAYRFLSVKPAPAPLPATPSPSSAPTSSADTTRFGQLTWTDPKPISQLTLFKSNQSGFYSDPSNWGKFFHIGSFSNGSKLILGQIPVDGPSNAGVFIHFVQYPDDKISYITTSLDTWTLQSFQEVFLPELIPIDIQLPSLQSPDAINQNQLTFNRGYSTGYLFSELKNPIKLFDSQFGPIYEVIKPNIISNVDISGKQFFLKLKDSTLVSYQLVNNHEPDVGDFQPLITWTDNSTSTVTLTQNIIMSCGSGGAVVPFIKDSSPLISNKILVGKTPKNENVFQVMDPANALVKALYENYQTSRDTSSGLLSLNEFASKHNHLLLQDPMGDWLVYANQDFAPLAECGKPVIYLYPQTPTKITVKVAADITKSEPTYPQDGWTVLAHPNGQLDYQGNIYPNLFWEGTGHGQYPNISTRGFVVAQADLISTIKKHLSLQGLNLTEIKDFLEFWQSKLPTTPYVRLTWLTTSEINKLAPLKVYPSPDSIIRVFLDFAGLWQPIKLTPQQFSPPSRHGFTLIEWGGLLVK